MLLILVDAYIGVSCKSLIPFYFYVIEIFHNKKEKKTLCW